LVTIWAWGDDIIAWSGVVVVRVFESAIRVCEDVEWNWGGIEES
jgi:hypothetical protein